MRSIKNWKVLTSLSLTATCFLPFASTSCSESYKYPDITISCMGDSITYGLGPNNRRMSTPYPKALQSTLSVGHCNNYGICGSTISNGSKSQDPMVDRLSSIVKTSDIVIFWGGVNDYRWGCDLGTKQDTTSSTIYGALNNVCSYLKQTFADKFVMFITPLPTTTKPTTYELTDVCEAITYTCSKFNFPVLDLYNESGFEKEMIKTHSDGIHPTQKFVLDNIVPKITEFIKSKIK